MKTYSGMWNHNIAGAVVSFLPYFVQPIFWLWIVNECVNHVGCVGLCGGCTTLHSVVFSKSVGFSITRTWKPACVECATIFAHNEHWYTRPTKKNRSSFTRHTLWLRSFIGVLCSDGTLTWLIYCCCAVTRRKQRFIATISLWTFRLLSPRSDFINFDWRVLCILFASRRLNSISLIILLNTMGLYHEFVGSELTASCLKPLNIWTD